MESVYVSKHLLFFLFIPDLNLDNVCLPLLIFGSIFFNALRVAHDHFITEDFLLINEPDISHPDILHAGYHYKRQAIKMVVT